MKPRFKYSNIRMEWLPRTIAVIVHYNDERLSWSSRKDIATEMFNEAGYSVDYDGLTTSSNGIDHIVTSTLYKFSPT